MAKNSAPQNPQEALAQLKKQFGSEVVVGGESDEFLEIFSTGHIGIDRALRRGGLPLGRIVEMFGPESSGKTTLALGCAKSVLDTYPDGYVAFVDAEQATDTARLMDLGIDATSKDSRFIHLQPGPGEDALAMVETLVSTPGVKLVIVDSVANLVPRAELEGDMGDAHVGRQARMMAQGLRKITAPAQRNGTTVIFVNQLREKIGVMFGSPETTPGGNALKFYSSVRIDVRSSASDANQIKGEGGVPIGRKVNVKIIKNKIGAPFARAEDIPLYYESGLDDTEALIDAAVEQGQITKAGAFYTIDGERYQGKQKAALALTENPELKARIRSGAMADIIRKYGSKTHFASIPAETVEFYLSGVHSEPTPVAPQDTEQEGVLWG